MADNKKYSLDIYEVIDNKNYKVFSGYDLFDYNIRVGYSNEINLPQITQNIRDIIFSVVNNFKHFHVKKIMEDDKHGHFVVTVWLCAV